MRGLSTLRILSGPTLCSTVKALILDHHAGPFISDSERLNSRLWALMSGLTTEVAFLSRSLRMPRIRQVAPALAKTARTEGWDPLELLVKVLAEEVAARETHGGENRIRAARFPQVKTLDDFDLAHQRSISRAQIS